MNYISSVMICFDYYGTLVKLDSPFEYIRIWLKKYMENHYPAVDFNKFYGRFSRNRAVLGSGSSFFRGVDLLGESLEKACSFYKVQSFRDSFTLFIEELFTAPEAFEDALDVLTRLRKSFRVGLLSNADNHILEKSIEKHRFEFDFIITSEDAKANKPDAGIFFYAMQKLGRRPQDLFLIGDSQTDDILGAGGLGIKTIWINRKNQCLMDGIKAPDYEAGGLSLIPDIIGKHFNVTI